jgi:hypothetical protein
MPNLQLQRLLLFLLLLRCETYNNTILILLRLPKGIKMKLVSSCGRVQHHRSGIACAMPKENLNELN